MGEQNPTNVAAANRPLNAELPILAIRLVAPAPRLAPVMQKLRRWGSRNQGTEEWVVMMNVGARQK